MVERTLESAFLNAGQKIRKFFVGSQGQGSFSSGEELNWLVCKPKA
jgi:hypothetical protein